jgi:glycosyltransferase involved in cell wall biosynthesis
MRAVLTLFPYLSLSRTPAIWNIGLGIEADGLVKKLQWISLQTVDHVFIESEEQAKRVFGEDRFKHHKNKFTIFHKGIDTSKFDPTRFSPPNEDLIRIGTAASLTPRKGLRYLIEALPAVLERHQNVILQIAGEAPNGHEAHKQELISQVHNLGIEEHVEFLGWVDNMPQFLNTLDVFVLPSLNEGIPGAVREAMAMKVPVIATNVGGTADIVIDGETGYLIPPGNSQAISDSIIQILSDEGASQQMSEKGYEHIQNKFSLKAYVKRYEKFLYNIQSRDDWSFD